MDTGSNKSLFTLLAVVIFGIFLSLSYYLFKDQLKGVLASVMFNTSEMTSKKLDNNGLIPTEDKYFTVIDNGDGTCTISGYDVLGGPILVIPNYINGKAVTRITNNAFQNKGLVHVTLPETLLFIDSGTSADVQEGYIGAFADNQLTNVVIPSGVKYIGDSAFIKNNISSLTLPEGIETIGYRTFKWNNLTSISLPNSLLTLSAGCFGFNQLTEVFFGTNLEFIGVGCFFSNKLSLINLPNSLVSIKNSAFTANPYITKVFIPSSVIDLSPSAFAANVIIER